MFRLKRSFSHTHPIWPTFIFLCLKLCNFITINQTKLRKPGSSLGRRIYKTNHDLFRSLTPHSLDILVWRQCAFKFNWNCALTALSERSSFFFRYLSTLPGIIGNAESPKSYVPLGKEFINSADRSKIKPSFHDPGHSITYQTRVPSTQKK